MNIKKIFFLTIAILFCTNIFSQDKISVSVNNKLMGETIVTENPFALTVNRSKYKNISKLVLKYKVQNQSPYKRTIEVTDAAENSLYILDEGKDGVYNINVPLVKKKLLTQKVIKVFLMENPANDRMSMPSRRKLLIELHLK